MSRYKKQSAPARREPALLSVAPPTLGMLYIVDVKVDNKSTRETIRHKLLMVGCEASDIERKLAWVFDPAVNSIQLKGVEKVREKVHFLSSVIKQLNAPVGPVIESGERTQVVPQQTRLIEQYDPKLYAIGISTTMSAKDEEHALRKLGHALVSHATEGKSHSGASLSEDSTVTIEEVPRSSGYAMPRDVSAEANRAHFVKG